MRYRGKGTLRAGRQKLGLWLRNIEHHVTVTKVMTPLFLYMRWSASRTPDEIYRLTVRPDAVDRMKQFPPHGVPVTGPNALCGAVGGPWDRLTLPTENHYLYQSIRSHLESCVPWTQTQIYDHPSYRDDLEKARRRCEKIERLVESIEENGYQPRFDPDAISRE